MLEWCEGRIPVPEGFVSFRWWKEDGKLRHTCSAPEGYAVEVKPEDHAAK